MNSRRIASIIARFNRKAIYVYFEECTSFDDLCVVIDAHYFGHRIQIALPNSPGEIKNNPECVDSFWLQLHTEEGEISDYSSYELFNQQIPTFKLAIKAVNDYIRSRPFTIFRKGKGFYHDLFDPNGNPFRRNITLQQAKSACDHNYIRK